MNISEKADKYAEGKANEAITRAIAQAYMDGYRDGYNDREQEIPEDLRENGVENVDLGLPSGTLWSSDYLKEDGKIVFLPHGKAVKMKIPSEEQLNELLNYCRFEYSIHPNYYSLINAKCIGPNGNVLYFYSMGMIKSNYRCDDGEVHFWIKSDNGGLEKPHVKIYNPGKEDMPFKNRPVIETVSLFTGYKLPVRLVR